MTLTDLIGGPLDGATVIRHGPFFCQSQWIGDDNIVFQTYRWGSDGRGHYVGRFKTQEVAAQAVTAAGVK